ncbi:hypothetical protein ACWDXV_23255 [Nocardia nova]
MAEFASETAGFLHPAQPVSDIAQPTQQRGLGGVRARRAGRCRRCGAT